MPYRVRPVELHKTGIAIFHKNTASRGVRSMPITCITPFADPEGGGGGTGVATPSPLFD